VPSFEIPVRLNQMLGDVHTQIEHSAYSPVEIAAHAADGGDCRPLLEFLAPIE
jgi:hypothetical protein